MKNDWLDDLIGQPRVDDIRNKTIPEEAFIAAGLRLKPCPFCGTEIGDTGVTHTPEDGNLHYVWCSGCHTTSANYSDRDDAVSAWNRRIPTKDALDHFLEAWNKSHSTKK